MYQLFNVTGGIGGDSHLIIGTDKTAIVDTGMAYCADQVINNIRAVLARHMPQHQQLDYIFLSHSHYDHLGALPYLRQTWPDLQVFGAAHAARVLQRPNALHAIRKLSEGGATLYGKSKIAPYDDSLMKVDHTVDDGDQLDLGNCTITTLVTPGHTQCSLSFLVDDTLLFASESTGYTSKCGRVNTTFVNSYIQAIESIKKCRELNAAKIVSPHYGLLSDTAAATYWDQCLQAAEYCKDFILSRAQQGMDEDKILAACFDEFYDDICRQEQPYRAWRLNTLAAIRTVIKELCPKN